MEDVSDRVLVMIHLENDLKDESMGWLRGWTRCELRADLVILTQRLFGMIQYRKTSILIMMILMTQIELDMTMS